MFELFLKMYLPNGAWLHLSWILMWFSSFITRAMAENNQDIIRLDCVSQHIFVQCEKARGRATRPPVDESSFDCSEGCKVHNYLVLLSVVVCLGNLLHGATCPWSIKPLKPKRNPTTNSPIDNYPTGSFDTSLLYLYGPCC